MSQIGPQLPTLAEFGREARNDAEDFSQLIKDIGRDKSNAQRLKHIDLNKLSPNQRSELSRMLSEQLRGQLPPKLSAALNRGTVDLAMLGALSTRLANSVSTNPADRAGVAQSPEAARAAAANPNLPQQALQWSRFVQMTTSVGGGGIQGRAGSAAPKGEQTVLAELIASKLAGQEGPGLRNPRLVAKALQNLTPQQRAALMDGVFGKQLAGALRALGITDPIMFVKAGALPSDRAALAAALGISRGRLLGLLMRAELLKIGPGRTGELAIRPEFLAALREAGIAMLGSLAALRGLSFEELKRIYNKLRASAGGFANVMKGGRVPVKRDLIHWARTAARRKSDILLADSEEYQGKMSRDDAMEMIQAWYLENLLWEELEGRPHKKRLQREEQQRREREASEQDDSNEDEEPEWVSDDVVPELEFDDERTDNLMCFWVVDQNPDPDKPGLRNMYVCVDPDTGGIIPQYISTEEHVPSSGGGR